MTPEEELQELKSEKNNPEAYSSLTHDEQMDLSFRILQLEKQISGQGFDRNPEVECFGCGA